jgi:hypothetical protein
VKAEEGLPDRTSSFAEEGTLAHDIVEKALRLDVNCDTICDRPDLEHIIEPAQVYVDYVRALPGKHRFIETRVDFSGWVTGGFGTADAIVIDEETATLHIADLKFGKGVRVDAENNPQAMLYALGAYNAFAFVSDIERVKIAIVQPRIDNISEWEISVLDLLKWGEVARVAADETANPKAKRVPGEKQCRFCKAKAVCPARAEQALEIAREEFTSIPGAYVQLLQPWEIAKLLPRLDEIESWCKAVRDHAQMLAFAGVTLPSDERWIKPFTRTVRTLPVPAPKPEARVPASSLMPAPTRPPWLLP